MVLTCPVCCENYVIVASLCERCKIVKHAMNLYSPDKVIDVIQKVLVRNEKQIDNKMTIYGKNETDYVKKDGKWIKKSKSTSELSASVSQYENYE